MLRFYVSQQTCWSAVQTSFAARPVSITSWTRIAVEHASNDVALDVSQHAGMLNL